MKSSEGKSTKSILEDHGVNNEQLERELLRYWINKCRKDTTATLDTLKERVEGLEFDEDYKGMKGSYIAGNNEALNEVKTLIDEAINE